MHLRFGTQRDMSLIADHNCAMALETESRALDRHTIEAGVAAVLKDPSKGLYLLAENEDANGNKTIAGQLMLTYEWSDWRNGPMWWFQSVYILPQYRGKGIFRMLYDFVMELASAKGVKELRLYVEKENRHAQEVYEALGMAESHYLMYEVPVPLREA